MYVIVGGKVNLDGGCADGSWAGRGPGTSHPAPDMVGKTPRSFAQGGPDGMRGNPARAPIGGRAAGSATETGRATRPSRRR
jgi:hypothetical protein